MRTVPLVIKTRHTPEDRYLGGALWTKAGWYWWFSAAAPNGESLVSVVKGPFDTEEAAKANAQEVMA
jgi:hypothetical protein